MQYLIFFDGACPAAFLIDANSFKSFNFSFGSIVRKSLKRICIYWKLNLLPTFTCDPGPQNQS